MFISKYLLIPLGLSAAIWVAFFVYFEIQSRKSFNVNFVPLSEFYAALVATAVVWLVYVGWSVFS